MSGSGLTYIVACAIAFTNASFGPNEIERRVHPVFDKTIKESSEMNPVMSIEGPEESIRQIPEANSRSLLTAEGDKPTPLRNRRNYAHHQAGSSCNFRSHCSSTVRGVDVNPFTGILSKPLGDAG